MNINNISINTLKPFKSWESPSFEEVSFVFNAAGIEGSNIEKILGINQRTFRRWTSKKQIDRASKSSIPYGVWCLLIYLITDKSIFHQEENKDVSKIPKKYFCNSSEYISPPKEILIKFVGVKSITGLQRKELATVFGWNPVYLGRTFNAGCVSYLNWILLLLLCGVDIKKMIETKEID